MPLAIAPGMGVRIPAGAGLAFAPGKILPVAAQPQEQTNWCWAACFSMIRQLFGSPVPQCELVSRVCAPLDCCATPGACNRTATPEQVAQLCGLDCDPPLGTIRFEDIVAQIRDGSPVEVVFLWNVATEAHVMLIVGWYSNGMVEVIDPWNHSPYSGQHTLSEVQSAFGHGQWVRSYVAFSRLAG